MQTKTLASPLMNVNNFNVVGGGILPPGRVDPNCNYTITLNCLRQMYNIDYIPQAIDQQRIGITGYLEQFANIEDLQSFYKMQRPDALGSDFEYFSVAGKFL